MELHKFLGKGESLIIYQSVKHFILILIESFLVGLKFIFHLGEGAVKFSPDSLLDEIIALLGMIAQRAIIIAILAGEQADRK